MGLRANPGNGATINRGTSLFVQNLSKKHLDILSYVGEDFVNNARDHKFAARATKGAFKDRTRNLKGSEGYIIALNGKILKQDVSGSAEGTQAANELAHEVLKNNPKGLVLIGVAGMEYAAAVEARGYDVITASSEEASKLLESLIKR
jgi:hypothetical protein